MDSSTVPHLRQSMSASRISAIDVSQLDKINAIPNKTTNNVLLDGLCQEDQLYLDAMMDDDSSNSDGEDLSPTGARGSPWSPAMAERPRMNNKRIKRIKPSYTITMSLEDISYIRPSWGMSKGIVKRLDQTKREPGKIDNKRAQVKGKPLTSKAKDPDDDEKLAATTSRSPCLTTYNLSLVVVITILSSLMLLSYYVDLAREYERTKVMRLELHPSERTLNILKFKDGQQVMNRELRLHYGRGLPANLRHDECTCQMYHVETRKYMPAAQAAKLDLDKDKCSACFDWAMRANLQVLVNRSAATATQLDGDHDEADQDALAGRVERQPPLREDGNGGATRQEPGVPLDEDLSITCYDIRWQSYDSLRTPLVDCIYLSEGDQWFGLGDIHSSPSVWPLNKFNHAHPKWAPTPLVSNLTGEFGSGSGGDFGAATRLNKAADLVFGSQVELELISSSGFYVGNVRSDFQTSVRIAAETREICISVACTDRCTSIWSRHDHLLASKFKYQNNLLEYSVCSASSWKVHVSRLINERLRRSSISRARYLTSTGAMQQQQQQTVKLTEQHAAPSKQVVESNAIERIEINDGNSSVQQWQQLPAPLLANPPPAPAPEVPPPVPSPPPIGQQQFANPKRPFESIGLIERTIFVTSQEYIPILDGQTLRQHVDKIVKLNLKTSPILVLDTRWQLNLGSFRINLAYFPKAKLLFEILHNKGFKIVLTVKPYIDAASIGPALGQLLDNNRLVTTQNIAAGPQNDDLSSYIETMTYDDHELVTKIGRLQKSSSFRSEQVVRRESFFKFRNQTILWFNQTHDLASLQPEARWPPLPYLFNCKESHVRHCALINLKRAHNRQWFIDMIKWSSFLSQEADGILLAGAHPEPREWDANYREAMAELVDRLFYKENYYVIPQWTGNFNYLQLAPRARNWDSLRSLVDSVLTLGMLGYSLVHPGSVWGDLKTSEVGQVQDRSQTRTPTTILRNLDDEEDETQRELRAERELIVRWLQVAVFLPILQFNDLAPLDKHNLHEQLQQLVRVRKLHIVPELKKHLPYTALLAPQSVNYSSPPQARHHLWRPAGPVPYQLPALRYTWATIAQSGGAQVLSIGGGGLHEPTQEAVAQQFMIGPDVLAAPVLQAGQRQKDIYLPVGMWHDELRQTNIRGGKWLRNYPIELNEIAWFTRARRR